jgi:integrase
VSRYKLRRVQNPSGRPSWMMDGYHKGRRIRRVVSGETKREAHGNADKVWAQLTLEINAPPEAIIRLGDALEAHRARPGVSPWTVEWERRCAARLGEVLGAETPLARITTAEIERYKTERGGKVAPRTCNMELQVLKACLNWLVEMGYASAVPCRIRKLPESKRRLQVLTAAEADRLLAECRGDLYDALACLVTMGLRRSELYNLRWSDVDWAAETVLVRRRKRGRSDEFRETTLPVGPVAMEVLRRRRQGRRGSSELIFGIEPSMRRRGPGEVNGVAYTHDAKLGTKLRQAARRAGIPNAEKIRPYDLRHTFATLALRSGANVRDVAELMGHRSAKLTLDIYAHEGAEGMRRAVEELGVGGQKDGREGRNWAYFWAVCGRPDDTDD